MESIVLFVALKEEKQLPLDWFVAGPTEIDPNIFVFWWPVVGVVLKRWNRVGDGSACNFFVPSQMVRPEGAVSAFDPNIQIYANACKLPTTTAGAIFAICFILAHCERSRLKKNKEIRIKVDAISVIESIGWRQQNQPFRPLNIQRMAPPKIAQAARRCAE